MANHAQRSTTTHSKRLWRQGTHWMSHTQYRTATALLGLIVIVGLAGSPMAAALTSPAEPLNETTFYIRPLPDALRVKRRYPMVPVPKQTSSESTATPQEKHLRVIPHKKSLSASIFLDRHELIRLRATETLPEPYALALVVTRKLYDASTSQPLSADTFTTQAVDNGNTVILMNKQPLLLVDTQQADATSDDVTTENLAKAWVAHLSKHFGLQQPELNPALANFEPTGKFNQSGQASWYGPYFHGRTTANGEKYNMYAMTAAHKTLPFNTMVQVTNHRTGKSTIVRINDRGPYAHGRIIDLSKSAAKEVGLLGSGVAPVSITAVIKNKNAPPKEEAVASLAFSSSATQPVLPIRPAVNMLPINPPQPTTAE